jgi:DNA-binding NtrC family response regulator
MTYTFAETEPARASIELLDSVLQAVGRSVICLDSSFRIVHASPALRETAMLEDRAGRIEGRLVADLLGRDLFGVGAPLREALMNGEHREGWRVCIPARHGVQMLSLSVAPLDISSDLDSRYRYVVVLMQADDDVIAGTTPPTVLGGLVARSSAMLKIFSVIEALHGSDAPVLISGEQGTGKESLARTIHEYSSRRGEAFTHLHCGSLPGELLESELFGHVRGAVSGAAHDRIGKLEMASAGTLFLDDVGELPLPLQDKLVRVLQSRTYLRVGETKPRTTDARIIAACDGDLGELIACGAFRTELRKKLAVIPMEIPPLRARREDIEPLARFLLRRVAERHGKHLRLSSEALRVLNDYDWPGNAREVENALEYAVGTMSNGTILQEHLPPDLMVSRPIPEYVAVAEEPQCERDRVRMALESNRWRREDAARALGISRATLWRRMKEHGLLRPE